MTRMKRMVRVPDRCQLEQSLRNPHPESLELIEAGFAHWAAGLDGVADLVPPAAGEPARWDVDRDE